MGRASRDPSAPVLFYMFVQSTVMVGLVPAMMFLSHRARIGRQRSLGSVCCVRIVAQLGTQAWTFQPRW